MNIKLNGKKLCQTDSFKYIRIYIDKNLTWKHHLNNVAVISSTANAMLSKIRPMQTKNFIINLLCHF